MEYALAGDGSLARAASAPKGREYEYRCLDCGERLKLRRGDVRAPHFSHLNESGCSGEGVIHHAAKLELIRALTERERPFTLEIPCSWPGCPCTVSHPFDHMLGAYTKAVAEYTWTTNDGVTVRFDVATLLHGTFQAGLEVYHAHRVPVEKKLLPLPSWIEVHASPLLSNPYRLVVVKDDVPINQQIEESRFNPHLVSLIDCKILGEYRAEGSGRWIDWREDYPENLDINEFSHFTCFEHTRELDRLHGIAYDHIQSQARSVVKSAPVLNPLEDILRCLRDASLFAGGFYHLHHLPAEALTGLVLRVGPCPHCQETGVFIMSDFVPQYRRFQGLLSLSRDGKKLYTHCSKCRKVANRKSLAEGEGVTLSGELVAAALAMKGARSSSQMP